MRSFNCLAWSFARALGMSYGDFIAEIGHDGYEVVNPLLEAPLCYKGIHPQEAVDVCLKRGVAATFIQIHPSSITAPGQTPREVIFPAGPLARFKEYVRSGVGVIEGATPKCGHAVAFDRGTIFDPRGFVFEFSFWPQHQFAPQSLWLLHGIGGAQA